MQLRIWESQTISGRNAVLSISLDGELIMSTNALRIKIFVKHELTITYYEQFGISEQHTVGADIF